MASLANIMSSQLAAQLHKEEEDAIAAAIEASMRQSAHDAHSSASGPEPAGDDADDDDASLRLARELQRRFDAGLHEHSELPQVNTTVTVSVAAGETAENDASTVPQSWLACLRAP